MKTMKRSSILVDDLLEEILLRLPVRHISRLKCVCKSWWAFIDDYTFMKKHYQAQYAMVKGNGNMPLFVARFEDTGPPPVVIDLTPDVMERARVYILSKQQSGEDVVTDLTPDLLRDNSSLFTNGYDFLDQLCCEGVAHGVVLLQWRDGHLTLWNLATRESKEVPNCSTPQTKADHARIIGFGFDPVSNDLKIVVNIVTSHFSGYIYGRFIMYSLRTNTWKRLLLEGFYIVDSSNSDSSLNGVQYWTAQIGDGGGSSRSAIISFNFSTEVFKVFDPPHDPEGIHCGGKIGLYMDSLAWIVRRNNNDLGDQVSCCFDIWVVEKFDDYGCGVPLTWQHLFTIGPSPTFFGTSLITCRMDGDMLLDIPSTARWVQETEANLYNPSTHKFKKVEVVVSSCYRYVESMFPLSRRCAGV